MSISNRMNTNNKAAVVKEVTCDQIRRYLDENQHVAADTAFRDFLATHNRAEVKRYEPELRALLDSFYKNRKRDLTSLLDASLGPIVQGKDTTTAVADITDFETSIHAKLCALSDYHIFQWTTYYRDFLGRLFDRLYRETQDATRQTLSTIATDKLAEHAADIFGKGYEYVRQRASSDARTKSLSGLQTFLSLPIEIYSTLAFSVGNANDARRLRLTCSAMLEGILKGYGSVALGDLEGWQLLPRFPRTWLHTFAFLTNQSARAIVEHIEAGELHVGLAGTILPVLTAVDRLLDSQVETEFCLPRLGQFAWDSRRIEVSLSLPQGGSGSRYLEIHCYLSPGFMQRGSLEESAGRAANLIAGPLRPDLRDWVEAHDILRTTFVDTEAGDDSATTKRALDVLNHELAKHMGTSRRAEPITFNLARAFPLQNPFLARYFLVHRNSVRNLLKTFERDTGVRLWCSVRRSGKTTACFDLGASNANALVINQTMEHTEQYSDANIFATAFSSALEAGKQLSPAFFRDAIRSCIRDRDTENRKLIFVLDEYETLFQRMHFSVLRDRELRYTVVQPLLNQMVGFSKENLVIFIGQRPDSHYILMDQNQLSPYVIQDAFPLFEHTPGRNATEFTELIRKVLTERVTFDVEFANAVYAETSGHPYLTVNILTDFFQWMIDEKRRASELRLHKEDFVRFADERLIPERLRRSGEYDFFRNAIMSALGDDTRQYDPWLFAVYGLLRAIAQEDPVTLACPLKKFDQIAEPLVASLGWDPAYLLSTATKANFLKSTITQVQPAIPILARLAAVSRARQ